MVRARLHLICGNCGCNDNFEYKHDECPADVDELTMRYETILLCKNCSTRHHINDYAVNKNQTRDKRG